MDGIIQYIFPNEKYDEINKLKFQAYIKDNHIYFVEYDEVISSVIKYAKYTRHPASFGQIGHEMGVILKDMCVSADNVIYVPMHVKDQAKRGFNQSLILARKISECTGIPICHKALKKNKKTRHQASLSATLRARNLAGAFVADDRYTAGRSFILVDDIYTTGTTLNQCKKVLLEKMAQSVLFATITKRII